MEKELLYRMALTRLLPLASDKQNILIKELGSATEVYQQRHHLRDILAPSAWRVADCLCDFDRVLPRCEQEYDYAQAHHIRILTLGDADYPMRLAQVDDAPLVLYALGNANLNSQHVVSVVGTRRCTTYGRDLCQRLVADLQHLLPKALVVSGLAYGIDIAAHKACLDSGLPTAAVLAHGLDQIYPRMHRQTAVAMLKRGGLVTEYMSMTQPDKVNFVQRNRIVAALSDAVVVVESAARGGSLITASLAFGYSREVCAFPGRISDAASAGCNSLIACNKAQLITSAEDLLQAMHWEAEASAGAVTQMEMFPQLEADESAVVAAMRQLGEEIAMPQLAEMLQWPVSRVLSATFTLEMKNMIVTVPGSRYRLKG